MENLSFGWSGSGRGGQRGWHRCIGSGVFTHVGKWRLGCAGTGCSGGAHGDGANGPVAGFHVEWFADDLSTDAEDIQQVNFVDDGRGEDAVAGDGQWTAVLPPQPEGTILGPACGRMMATQSWRISPRDGDPFDWHGRFVGTSISGETRPYQIWIDPDQWTAMWDQIEDNRVIDCDPNPGWTARVPAVFVFEGDVFDVWVRYQGSRWNRTNGREMTWELDGPERPSPLRCHGA